MTKREQILVEALDQMKEHLCDSTGDKTCSQMWYQDVIEEALAQFEAEKPVFDEKACKVGFESEMDVETFNWFDFLEGSKWMWNEIYSPQKGQG